MPRRAASSWHKLYSFHAREIECIGKGKASAPYEFGTNASIVAINAAPRTAGSRWMKALPGNPYDGRTPGNAINSTARRLRDRARLCRQELPWPQTENLRRLFISGQKRSVKLIKSSGAAKPLSPRSVT
ncbi:hypothetical protein CQ10_37580 [Bradyrhizobium valentinum]|nr:hypothetical protein CQ10_37580 [Bradyrhizobium valentinum]